MSVHEDRARQESLTRPSGDAGKLKLALRTLPVHQTEGSQVGTPDSIEVDARGLESALRATVKGEVRFDAGSRGMYAHDASNYRMVPIGVVVPRTGKDVVAAVAAARRFGAPILSRGGGTAIPGQGVNTALLLDFSKYLNRVVQIDAENRIGVVEPGCNLDHFNAAAKKYGLTFGPDPATHSRNTIGGMVGNNSCGIHSVMAGRTADNIEELEVLLYDGTTMRVGPTSEEEFERIQGEGGRKAEIYLALRNLRDRYAVLIRERFPKIPRRVSGFNLDELLPEKGFNVARALVGTEGTCVTVLRAWCKLVPYLPARSLVVAGFPGIAEAGDFVPEALKFKPIGCEGMDETFFEDMRKKNMHPKHLDLLPEGRAWLLIEFGGETREDSDRQAQRLIDDLGHKKSSPACKLLDNPKLEADLWKLREEGLGATAFIPGENVNHEGWEDTAVPPDKVGSYLRDFKKLIDEFGYKGSLYGHLGDGCIHVRLDFDLETEHGIRKYREFVEKGADLVVSYHGSLSGEHGDGQARAELLEKMYGPELIDAFAEFKRIWDPDWKMNPGKVVAPYRLDENLELGTRYDPPHVETHFQFPNDRHSFAFATRRCVGAGVCRQTQGGTMCPSYMVTHEERHSTRGRARLLFEMMEGDPVKDGWKSEEVKEALDLCLSCKGCKGECPVQVDMASYKAEFLSHYYERRLRPRQAYVFGFIQVWSQLASLAPGFLNLLLKVPPLSALAKKAAGIAPKRSLPRFAPYTFREWWAARDPRNLGRKVVMLWPDTFNNHYHPTTLQAAVEVLEDAGFQVAVPRRHFCCGRPLYDYGFLPTAKRYLEDILVGLREEIREGLDIVVLEPSCCSVFRDELLNLFPDNEDARRLGQQVFLLSEFLTKRVPGYNPPKLKRKALLHGHCHHKSLMKMDDEQELLTRMGVDFDSPETGCCGMAGGFGFEEGDHYDVSVKCGERVLFPKLRETPDDTLIIADGFSCREQVSQSSRRVPLHLAQVMQMAIRDGETGARGPLPERSYVQAPRCPKDDLKTVVLAGLCMYAALRLVKWAASSSAEGRGRH